MYDKECKVCQKMTKEKYKHYKTWKTLAIVFICISVVLSILYFASGAMFVEKTVENDIRIENDGGHNNNNVVTGDGATISGTVKTESNIGLIMFGCVIVITGGIIGGCYIISKNKSNKQNNDS